MTKTELIDAVSNETGITKKAAKTAIESIFDIIAGQLAKGEKVQLVGFGMFQVNNRAARTGHNPQDPKKVIKIPAMKLPAFRAGKQLKEAVNK